MANKTIMTLVVVAAFLTPAAAAGWSAYGSFEPNSPWDRPTMMWSDAPGAAKNRVYFNAYTMYYNSVALNFAPISTPVLEGDGSTMDLPGDRRFEAFFGVWIDCNGDGYVGMADTGLREYRGELLDAAGLARCPNQGGTPNSWVSGAHHYRNWVSELVPLASRQLGGSDVRVYKDWEAMVWGEPGLPTDKLAAPPADTGTSCSTFPKGNRNTGENNAQTVGGWIRAIDCEGENGYVAAWDDVLGDTPLAWGADPRQSSSPLNVDFGDDHSDGSVVRVTNCDPSGGYNTGDFPVDDDFDNRQVLWSPHPEPVNTNPSSWSVPATLNHTKESFGLIPREQDRWGNSGKGSSSNCNYEDDWGHDFYDQFQVYPVAPAYKGKTRAWSNFEFQTASRGGIPANVVLSGSSGAPTDIGIRATNPDCASPVTQSSNCYQSNYIGPRVLAYTPALFRGTVTDADFAHARNWTFYAYAGPNTTAKYASPSGGPGQWAEQGRYGAPQCGTFTPGIRNGWNCDPNEWYLREDGSKEEETRPTGNANNPFEYKPNFAKPNQVYHFRDVDCFDGDTGFGFGATPAYYGNGPCPAADGPAPSEV